MSEISSYDTDISIPSLAQHRNQQANLLDQEPREAILKRALALAAQDHGGEVTTDITDCDGERIPCLIGLKIPQFPGGVGVTVSPGGDVGFVYDAYGDAMHWGQRIAGEISANYNAIAVRMALMAMNLEVRVKEAKGKAGEKIIQLEGRV